jgi:PAS domain S-box-containing protein
LHDTVHRLASEHTFMAEHPLVLVALAALVVAGIMGIVAGVLLLRLKKRLTPFRITFESASVGITHTGLDGRWLRVNDRMLSITGYTRDELMQMSYRDITLEADRGEDLRLNRQIVSGEIDSFQMEKRFRRKDGRIIWAKVTATLARKDDGTPDYYIAIVEDIDELKRSELTRMENEARFRAFWDNSPFNQSVKDAHGRLVEVNRTYRETFGISDRDVAGFSDTEVHGSDWAPTIDAFDREVLQSRTTRTSDIQLPGKGGAELTIRVTKFPIYDADGHAVGVGGISYDITNQIRNARELREREERFRATFEQSAVGIAHLSFDG